MKFKAFCVCIGLFSGLGMSASEDVQADTLHVLECTFAEIQYPSEQLSELDSVMRGYAQNFQQQSSFSVQNRDMRMNENNIFRKASAASWSAPKFVISDSYLRHFNSQTQPASLKMVRQEYYPRSWTKPALEVDSSGVYHIVEPKPVFGEPELIGIIVEAVPNGDSIRITGRIRAFAEWKVETLKLELPNWEPLTFQTRMPILEIREQTVEIPRSGGKASGWQIGKPGTILKTCHERMPLVYDLTFGLLGSSEIEVEETVQSGLFFGVSGRPVLKSF